MKLINMLPPIHKESKETAAIINAMQPSADKLREIYENFPDEMYVHTAVKSLYLWEKMCGIPTLEGKSIADRRSAILAKLRGNGTCTKAKLREIALSFDCGEIEVTEDSANYSFTITFISEKGTPERINEFKAAIESVKPAHLEVFYVYTYRKWGEFSAKKWGELAQFTWQEIKEMEVIE